MAISGSISVKYSLNLSAIFLVPIILTPSWTKLDGKSDLKVFLFIFFLMYPTFFECRFYIC